MRTRFDTLFFFCYNKYYSVHSVYSALSGEVNLLRAQSQISYSEQTFRALFDRKAVCFLLPFFALCLPMFYWIATDHNFYPDAYYMLHYIYTYKHGFHSRGLIGEIISWFADTVSPELERTVVIFGSFFLIFCASLCIAYALHRTRSDPQRFWSVFFLILFLCLSATGYRFYVGEGKLDQFFWAVLFLAVFLSEFRIGVWFVPPLCLLAVLINPVFLMSCMPIIALALLQKLHDEHGSKKMILICAAAYLGMIALGLFSLISENHLGFETSEEYLRFYGARYTDPSFFTKENFDELYILGIYDYFHPLSDCFRHTFHVYFLESGWPSDVTNTLLVALPIYPIITVFWLHCKKSAGDLLQKLIFLFCALASLLYVLMAVLSWETPRYVACNTDTHLCLLIYFLVHANVSVLKVWEDAKCFCGKHKVSVAVFAMYLSVFFAQ